MAKVYHSLLHKTRGKPIEGSRGTSSAFSGPLTYYASGSIIDPNREASGKQYTDADQALLWIKTQGQTSRVSGQARVK